MTVCLHPAGKGRDSNAREVAREEIEEGISTGERVQRSISPGVKLTAKRRSVLREDKYAPGDTSRWKHVSARYPALYQALLDEPDHTVRKSMYGIAVKRAG